ncbi:hypothetical protein Pla22_31310 [Rubripirellula amarantea]|uniref:Uncharacterized protein n=1 Tax=Rubripirellula amarantea TaxID=2527999 RepID=A0A5C5WJS4_9BACT|nr:hypothetical protein Pla22_31310 [Rubripirellula amarantea]
MVVHVWGRTRSVDQADNRTLPRPHDRAGNIAAAASKITCWATKTTFGDALTKTPRNLVGELNGLRKQLTLRELLTVDVSVDRFFISQMNCRRIADLQVDKDTDRTMPVCGP